MQHDTDTGLQEGTGRQPDLIRRAELVESAPTEPAAFLQWATQRRREAVE